MKKFKFRLQKVLDLKQFKEEKQKLAVIKLSHRLKQEKNILVQQEEEYKTLKSELNLRYPQRIAVNDILVYENYFKYLEDIIETKKRIILELGKKLKVEQGKLFLLTKERKTLDKLKTKKHDKYWSDCLKEEQLLLDEIATGLISRNRTTN